MLSVHHSSAATHIDGTQEDAVARQLPVSTAAIGSTSCRGTIRAPLPTVLTPAAAGAAHPGATLVAALGKHPWQGQAPYLDHQLRQGDHLETKATAAFECASVGYQLYSSSRQQSLATVAACVLAMLLAMHIRQRYAGRVVCDMWFRLVRYHQWHTPN